MQKKTFKDFVVICLIATLIFTLNDFGNISYVRADNDPPYLIKVNKQQNTVTVYAKNEKGKYTVPIKAMTCSVGSATPLGTFRTPERYRWRLLMGDVWGQYSTRITGSILFHSVWYYKMDNTTLSATQYNKLGTAASHGCVRLTTIDAKWIYDNCPIGTTVIIYEDADPGPLGKPKTLILPAGTGWDPTDPDPKNPWKDKKATITGVKNVTVKQGEKASLTEGVKAKSLTGIDITKDMVVTGSVDFNKLGKYTVKYSITDAGGTTDTKKAVFTVKENKALPVITGVTDKVVNGETLIDRGFALKGVTASWNKKSISKNNINTDITYNEKSNKYTIKYSVTAINNKTRKAKAIITVDDTPPTFTGVKDRIINEDQVVDRDFVMKGVSAYDNDIKIKKANIEVIITDMGNRYRVKYKVKDAVKNKTTVFATFTISTHQEEIIEEIIIEAEDKIISPLDIVDEEFALEGVTAWKNGEDITEEIIVFIAPLKDGEYIITYSVTNSNDEEIVKSVTYTVDGNEFNEDDENFNENIDKEDESLDEVITQDGI